jgi:predicted ATPase
MLGNTLFHIGEFIPAREHLEQGIALYDLRQHRHHAFRSGQDAGVACLGYTAWILWCLGYPNQARKRCQEALALAQELSHPFNIAWTALSAIVFYQLLREEQATQEQAGAAITLASEQGFAFLLAYATCFKGWALAMQGRGEEGVAQIRQGMVAWQATGAEFWRPHILALLAEAYAKVGQAEDGLNMLTEALEVADKTGERSYEAELYRLKGTLTLQSKASLEHVQDTSKTGQNKSAVANPRPLTPNPQGEAAACFLKAIEIARTQSAKSWELRATVSLARLWPQRGKKKQAHERLAEIYNWFTEGFDTADLQEAKALLEELR